VKSWLNHFLDENSISSEIIKSNGKLDQNKAYKFFDIKKFQSNIEKELRSAYPDRKKLENQCISIFALVQDMPELLEIPCYVLIVNIVAIDMLKSRLPIADRRPKLLNLSIDKKQTDQESDDLYSTKTEISSDQSKTSGFLKYQSKPKPSKLPARESKLNFSNKKLAVHVPLPDYDVEEKHQTTSIEARYKTRAEKGIKLNLNNKVC